MQSIYGMQIIVSNLRCQKIQLSEKLTVSDRFREEMNQYLLDNFGYRYVLGDGVTLVSEDERKVMMNPNTKRDLDHVITQMNDSFGRQSSIF